jgi:hypothetical protein
MEENILVWPRTNVPGQKGGGKKPHELNEWAMGGNEKDWEEGEHKRGRRK